MTATALTARSRAEALEQMTSGEPLDLLVVGGGVTGAGIVLDAASRGLRVGIVEAGDWASGTSQWSSKLVHGGLRYLYQLNFALVAEALKERGLLLTSLAPHLVTAQPFLWPLKMPVVERSYSAVGVGMYDALAVLGAKGAKTVPLQKHYSKKGARRLFPDIREDALSGAIRFYDARVDDARLVIDLVRTAAGYGALAATRTRVTSFVKDETGRVVGAEVHDAEAGRDLQIRARRVIAAAGVWTEEVEQLSGTDEGLKVLASKGIHIVVPKDRIAGDTGLFLRTEKSVLFVIPWERYWVIGTTDTPWTEDRDHPVTTAADVDYVLEHANSVLARPLGRDDIIGTYAGLRPLLQPHRGDGSASTKVSREHTVAEVAPGLWSIAGGKLTTYRVMAQDAVDVALGKAEATRRPSVTDRTPLVGAAGYQAYRSQAPRIAATYGWTEEQVEHLLSRYGSELPTLLAMVDEDPSLGRPLTAAPAYLRAEAVFAVTHEGALHLEDVLMHRIRLHYETRDRGLSALAEITALVAPLLGWDAERAAAEQQTYRDRVAGEAAAELERTDADASRARARAAGETPRPVLPTC
ncbi:glycerol-3-phosphate dehydrogenase/oxidase [Arsenicicoccus dermatophilus]|uniref:glycerol-3-phosphate dehydrogenase/oxidase n=1 Tax=Arsenicicoccus dermatophilus TaxID=1076331 RepID=UPI001F4CD84C|nr:glycerol-3-phosphate dehydrogenase/oxidase [Arsenicicoccus dermatophilus]MCH8612095.1 glycerol-3-phosphate dehydrogenase/oxidase [Arsenicicoccus dermatophilus]